MFEIGITYRKRGDLMFEIGITIPLKRRPYV
jgi:hypothetical protein